MSQPHDETLETRRNTAQPDEPAAWVQRGSAQLAVGDFDAAVISFSPGLALAPRMFVARLPLGMAQEQLGPSHAALKTYFMAIESARALGDQQSVVLGKRVSVRVNIGGRRLI